GAGRLEFGTGHPYTAQVALTLRQLDLRDDSRDNMTLAGAAGFAGFTADCPGRVGNAAGKLGCNPSPLLRVFMEAQQYLAEVAGGS
ncbi:hypothetical protein, partial [Zavarzinella formosa]|uniref:hypothetical protein n=1 Tax=Zavarzinella formosa TaxID=360055 RepID=UPI0005944C08